MGTSVTKYMTVLADRCLNSRGLPDYCQVCLDTCPMGAIDISDAGIRFNASRCNDCALCVSDCPTEVFIHDGFAPMDYINLAEGNKELKLHCQFSGAAEAKEDTLSIPCHGLLGDRLLLGMRAAGVEKVHLYGLNKCKECPTRVGAKRLAQTLENSAPSSAAGFPLVLDASGTTDAIATTDDTGQRAEAPMNRRNFLDASLNAVAYAALSALPARLSLGQGMEVGKLVSGQNEYTVKHIPQSHRLALLSLHTGMISMDASKDGNTWFHEIRAQGVCDACGICFLSCPTGALFAEDSGQTLMLHHRPAACIGCGLCVSSCPHQALRLSPAQDNSMIRDDCSHTLFECERSKCKLCGNHFTTLNGSVDLCRKCENERAIQAHWTDKPDQECSQ